jgi:hypothetical protein
MNREARNGRAVTILAVAMGLVWLGLFVAGFILTIVWLLSAAD